LGCYFGYDISEFSNINTKYYLCTFQGLKYNLVNKDTVNRSMFIRRVILSDNSGKFCTELSDFPEGNYTFYWEKDSGIK
jgi:hypothetical protein